MNFCSNCGQELRGDEKHCPECGCSLENQKENNNQEKKQDFFSFTEDIASKIQNKIDNEDIFNTNDIKEMVKNLDEDSINKLLDKYGISPSRIKFLTLNKLFEKVDINRLKEDLIEFGIISPDSDIETVKAEVIIEDEESPEKEAEEETSDPIDEYVNDSVEEVKEESPEEEVEEKNVAEETSEPIERTAEKTVNPKENEPSEIDNICSECGFENRPNVKFCTKCGNKLI